MLYNVKDHSSLKIILSDMGLVHGFKLVPIICSNLLANLRLAWCFTLNDNEFENLQGGMENVGMRQYSINSLDISADGVLAADYVEELNPSVILQVNSTVRLHAGSAIAVKYTRIKKHLL